MDLNVFDIFIPPAAKTFKCVMYKKVILLHFFGRLAPMAEAPMVSDSVWVSDTLGGC